VEGPGNRQHGNTGQRGTAETKHSYCTTMLGVEDRRRFTSTHALGRDDTSGLNVDVPFSGLNFRITLLDPINASLANEKDPEAVPWH
jgi:hypothetical protein